MFQTSPPTADRQYPNLEDLLEEEAISFIEDKEPVIGFLEGKEKRKKYFKVILR